MMRISAFALLLWATGCSGAGAPGALNDPLDDASTPSAQEGTDVAAPSVVPDASVDVSPRAAAPVLAVGAITGATPDEIAMIHDGVALANTTMATACFRDFVLAASWTENNGLTQSQIYAQLCSGPITVAADMYTGSWYDDHVTRTVGYENEPGTVHMNRYFVNSASMVADNLIHEAEGHSQGFHHYGVKATSVPYGLNAAYEACAP